MKKCFFPILFIFTMFSSLSSQKTTIKIIPQPVSVIEKTGSFEWDANTVLLFEAKSHQDEQVVEYILEEYHRGFRIPGENEQRSAVANASIISFNLEEGLEHKEGYALSIDETGIQCRAQSSAGWVYAWQSIKQLLPSAFLKQNKELEFPIELTALEIKDHPRFAYRGMHLDVCRHFFTVAEVKKYIDLLTFHKMNRFHWHLTEDQGWRIEIKKYPKLTEIGGYRKETLIGHYSDRPHRYDGERYGGFYTQEEIREVVDFAMKRNVTIIPEIEMPGHSLAALAAYPELACTEGPFEVATKWGVFEDVYCPTETTFAFLADVLKEVAGLFPGPYIHIGGDECPKTRWKESEFCQQLIAEEGLKDEYELQSYFIQRIEKILQGYGKKLIGWDEILEGGLSPGATVMSWRGIQGGIEAAKMRHDVIMTPGSHCYFDHYQSDHPDEPVAIGGFTPLSKVYAYEPVPTELSQDESAFILGAQANLWTEYIPDFDHLTYMAYPRACALSEVLWLESEQKDFSSFSERLLGHQERLDAMGVNYARHLMDVDMQVEIQAGSGVLLRLEKKVKGDIRFGFSNEAVDSWKSYEQPVEIVKGGVIKAALFRDGKRLGRINEIKVDRHLATGASISLESLPSESYNSGGKQALVNGVGGSDQRYGDKEWLGFSGDDLVALIDMGKEKEVRSFSTRFYYGPGQWIYGPSKVTVYGGDDPEHMQELNSALFEPGLNFKAVPFDMTFNPVKCRYLKVHAENFGIIPQGKQGGGHPAWLFVDELRFY